MGPALAVRAGAGALIGGGLDRELRQKATGLRTCTRVGIGSATLHTLISKYGFFDVLGEDVILDPSRVAA